MIRVLVADDTRTFRALLRSLLEQAPDVLVVGEAADGHEAVAQVLALQPDVVTMDVRMPGLDGIAAIEAIMARAPTPVVVVSAEGGPEHQDVIFRALAAGAVEVLPKPSLAGRFERQAEEIRRAVRAMAGLTLVTRRARPALTPWPGLGAVGRGAAAAPTATPTAGPASSPTATSTPTPSSTATPTSIPIPTAKPTAAPASFLAPPLPRPATGLLPVVPPRVIGLAASTGGPPALARLLASLPGAFPAALLVVQHIAQGFEDGLVRWLAGETALAVKVAEHGEPIRPATAYVAPASRHLTALAGTIFLDDGPEEGGFRPSATVLFRALAREYGGAAAGVVLTGMGQDGAAGLLALRERGGATLAQGPRSAVVYGMPRVAAETGAAAAVLELEELGPELVRLVKGPRGG